MFSNPQRPLITFNRWASIHNSFHSQQFPNVYYSSIKTKASAKEKCNKTKQNQREKYGKKVVQSSDNNQVVSF